MNTINQLAQLGPDVAHQALHIAQGIIRIITDPYGKG